ncbi:MAG: substrate-binding domain-containing protein [Desulfovibrio sp.]|jgi:phosphate transport system substrate-binding protein|nr:substrate-binding domain-containing protein [Desulfovibrio sp.]
MTQQDSPVQATPFDAKSGRIEFLHILRVVFLGFILGPLTASFALYFKAPAITFPSAFLVGLIFGVLCVAGRRLPPTPAGRYILPLCFAWVLFPAFFPFFFASDFSGVGLSALRFLPYVYIFGLSAGYVGCERRRADRIRFGAAGWAVFGALLMVPLVHICCGTIQDREYAAKRGHGFERVGGFSSTDLRPYDPRVPDAITPRLEEPSIFVISGTDDLPVLDGAEAAFPVYAAFAAACYADLPPLSEEHLARYDQSNLDTGALTFTNTFHAFRRLLDRSVDIFFGAHPSQRQMQQTTEKGMELVLTPIAKEAFVFFVNDANPVNGLTTGQIRDIYSGKVRNWKKLGGRDAEVMAFQRPEYSGSQSVMRSFMGETEMEEPLQDRLIGGMGGVVEETSEYRNAPGAIGYSFRYFLTGLGRQPRIKMLAVDGILPTPETILYGEYPHVTNLYAITLKDNPNPYVKPFLLWMQGEQGQYLVEKIGYVRLR